MPKGEYEMNRMSRGSSLFREDIQRQLLNALKSKELRIFKKIIATNKADVNHDYDYPEYKTLLDIACSTKGNVEFVELLLENKADVNKVNSHHRRSPIHFAVEAGDVATIKALVGRPNLDINAKSKGNTALLLAIKQIEDIEDDREASIKKYEEIVELLVKADIDVNIPDSKNVTPIHSAAKQGLENIVEIILEHSAKNVDLDSYKDRKQKSARDLITETFPHLLEKIPLEVKERKDEIDVHKLFSFLSAHDEDRFIQGLHKFKKQGNISTALTENNGLYTMLQLSCSSGLDRAAEALLDNGADPNLTSPGDKTTPIQLACRGGYYKILQHLVENERISLKPVNKESLLQIVIRECKKDVKIPNSDYEECLEILLKKDDTNINFVDVKNNTALHYAARSGNQETVLKLLRKGASIGVKNSFDEPVLADIQPKTLENYLDECLTTNEDRPTDEDFELIFDYGFLVPPVYDEKNETCSIPLVNDSNMSISSNDRFLVPETEALLYMSQNEDLRPLLKHPVITSFIFMKWNRISCLFHINITFYCLFWISLMAYVLSHYLSANDNQEDSVYITISKVCRVLTIIGLVILLIRELIQLIVSPIKYLLSFENWVEMCLIAVTTAIVSKTNATEEVKDQLAPVAILLSSLELIMLAGHFPIWSTYIQMLKTVSWNFLKILLWYCILIIAFSLSFYTLFSKSDKKEENNENTPFNPNTPEKEEERNFFEYPGGSLFKTIVMLTGEFDASSIDFDTYPVISYTIFVIFVFMIPIVLLNLLNGLAVSDTQAIKADAELVGLVLRIQLISYFEHVFLGDTTLYRKAISKSQNNCCWLPGQAFIGKRIRFFKPLARRICLFPNVLPKAKIGVKVNQLSKVEIVLSDSMKKKNRTNEESQDLVLCCLNNCNEIHMDRKITKAAKALLHDKKYNESSDLESLKKRMEQCENVLNLIYESVKK